MKVVSDVVHVVKNRPIEEAEYNTRESFTLGAYWKLLEPTGPPIDDSVMNVAYILYFALTVPDQEHAVDCDGLPTKRIYGENSD